VKTLSTLTSAIASLSLLTAGAVCAHHSDSVYFIDDRTADGGAVKIEGTVSRVRFINPHVEFFVAVTNSAGEQERWAIESDSWNQLRNYGWTNETIEVGDRVEVIVSKSKFHNTAGRLRDLIVHASNPGERSQMFLEFIPRSIDETGLWDAPLDILERAPQCEDTVQYDHEGQRGEEILLCLSLDDALLDALRTDFADRVPLLR